MGIALTIDDIMVKYKEKMPNTGHNDIAHQSSIYRFVGQVNKLGKELGLLSEDATVYAFQIESGIIANGFTGSFIGYSDDKFDSAVKKLKNDFKIPM